MLKTSGFMIACAVALGLATACQTRPVTSTAPATAAVAGIELHQPRQGLYTAGQPATGDWQAIAARGVTTVVNLRTPSEMQGRDEAAEVRAAGMRYIQIPIAGAEGITDANARLLRDALAAADGSVLVHCASANRAGGLLALAEARHGGVAPEQAVARPAWPAPRRGSGCCWNRRSTRALRRRVPRLEPPRSRNAARNRIRRNQLPKVWLTSCASRQAAWRMRCSASGRIASR
jgi:uncharacterized protein (TIGR01244 family)